MEQFTFPALEGDRVQASGPTREHILASARAEAGTIAAEARTSGHDEGFSAGMAEAQAQLGGGLGSALGDVLENCNLHARDTDRVQFGIETFNTFNHTQWASVNGGISVPNPSSPVTVSSQGGTGQVSATRDSRNIQLGLKLLF